MKDRKELTRQRKVGGEETVFQKETVFVKYPCGTQLLSILKELKHIRGLEKQMEQVVH